MSRLQPCGVAIPEAHGVPFEAGQAVCKRQIGGLGVQAEGSSIVM